MTAHISKRYKCTQCGHIKMITTNHYGDCWSWAGHNCCPKCPPYKKFEEYGGRTNWECLDKPEGELKVLHDEPAEQARRDVFVPKEEQSENSKVESGEDVS